MLANFGPGADFAKRLSRIEDWLSRFATHPIMDSANALYADGSIYAYNNTVPGTSTYAVWVGNDATNHFGRPTSSIRYKANVRRHRVNPANVLALKPVVYQRPDNGWTTEYGLIAEQVAETLPEIVQWFDGKIDGLRYDLLTVALLEVVKDQQRRIEVLEAATGTSAQPGMWHEPEIKANNPPDVKPTPDPYEIVED